MPARGLRPAMPLLEPSRRSAAWSWRPACSNLRALGSVMVPVLQGTLPYLIP